MKRAILSILSAVGFAALLTLFPGDYFTVVLIYFLVFFGITMFLGIRNFRRGMAAAHDVAKGKPIIEIDEKEAMKLMEKDKELLSEFRKFSRMSLTSLFFIPVFMLAFIFLFPVLPPAFVNSIGPHVGVQFATFLGYLAIFGTLTAISLVAFKPPVIPRIARSVKIYEGGIVIDKNLGLKTPIEVSDYRVNPERKFVEFKTNNQIYRIYYKDIKELDSVLTKMLKVKTEKPESQRSPPR